MSDPLNENEPDDFDEFLENDQERSMMPTAPRVVLPLGQHSSLYTIRPDLRTSRLPIPAPRIPADVSLRDLVEESRETVERLRAPRPIKKLSERRRFHIFCDSQSDVEANNLRMLQEIEKLENCQLPLIVKKEEGKDEKPSGN